MMMIERRKERSGDRDEAVRMLLEAVRERSDVSAVALVDSAGTLVQGTGPRDDLYRLELLAFSAAPEARWAECAERLLKATDDVLTHEVDLPTGPHWIIALGTSVRRMADAAHAIERIDRQCEHPQRAETARLW